MRRWIKLALFLGILLALAMPTRATVYAKIKGRVVDAETGKGVEGVTIYIYHLPSFGPAPLAPPYSLKTDSEGRWEKQVKPGKYCVDVRGVRKYNYYVALSIDKEKLRQSPTPLIARAWAVGNCFEVLPGEEKYVEFPVRKGRWVKFILTSLGQPLKGVEVLDSMTDERGEVKIGGFKIGYKFPEISFRENYQDIFHACRYLPDSEPRYSAEEEIHLDFPWIKAGSPGIGIEVEGGEIIRVEIRKNDSTEIGGLRFRTILCNGAFTTLPSGSYHVSVLLGKGYCYFDWNVKDKFYLIKVKVPETRKGYCKILKVTPLDRLPQERLKKIKKKEMAEEEVCPYTFEKAEKVEVKAPQESAGYHDLFTEEYENSIPDNYFCPHVTDEMADEIRRLVLVPAGRMICEGCEKWNEEGRECIRKLAKEGLSKLKEIIWDCLADCRGWGGGAIKDKLSIAISSQIREDCPLCEKPIVLIHELLHLGSSVTGKCKTEKEVTVQECANLCTDDPKCRTKGYGEGKCDCGDFCEDKKDEDDGDDGDRGGDDSSSSPGWDHPDDAKGVIDTLFASLALKFSKIADTTLWKKGYWSEGGDLLNFFKMEAALVESDQSPLNMQPPAPVWILPTGSLYGEEGDLALKYSLDEYIKNGGTALVFAQQHGSDFSILPTPSDLPLYAYGWREDQSCSWARGIEKGENFPKIQNDESEKNPQGGKG